MFYCTLEFHQSVGGSSAALECIQHFFEGVHTLVAGLDGVAYRSKFFAVFLHLVPEIVEFIAEFGSKLVSLIPARYLLLAVRYFQG